MSEIPMQHNESWYPGKKLNYTVGILLAIVVQNSSEPFIRDPAVFVGGLVVQLLIIFCFPLGIARLVSGKARNPVRFGWVFLVSIIAFAVLAYVIAHQSTS